METVLITGCSRGIGLELTRQFLDLGYQVISSYRKKPSEQLAKLDEHAALRLIELEVTNDAAIANMAKALSDTSLDILINNAGVIGPAEQSIQHLKSDEWLETFAVNSVAPMMVSQAVLPQLKRSSNPRLLTISSQMAQLTSQSTGMYAYRSSKAAVNKSMQVLATELKSDGVTVCLIHPGWVQTDMGGQNADISASQSAKGIISFVNKMNLSQSGQFYSWTGDALDW